MAASCAPCIFGPVSTTQLSYPSDVATVQVSVIPHISLVNNGSLSTSFETATVTPTGTPVIGTGPPTTTLTVSDPNQLTWSTLGTVLTYPTTYVEYLAFAGAAASGTQCAQSLSPKALNVPTTAAASLLYPLQSGLPAGLISYLDGAGVPGQLNGDAVSSCAALSEGAAPASSALSIPAPTSFAPSPTSTKAATTSSAAASLEQVTQTSLALVSSVTGPPIIYSGSVSVSLTAPLGVTLASSSGKASATPTSAVQISSLISLLNSKASSSTVKPASQSGFKTGAPGTASATYSAASTSVSGITKYTGAAARQAAVSVPGGLMGVLAYLLLL